MNAFCTRFVAAPSTFAAPLASMARRSAEWAADQRYFLQRMNAALAMAEAAADSTAKLIHFDLAGRYSVLAARAAMQLVPRESLH